VVVYIRRELQISQAGRIQESEAIILFSSIALWWFISVDSFESRRLAESKNPRIQGNHFIFGNRFVVVYIRRQLQISQAGRIQKSEAIILFSSIALWWFTSVVSFKSRRLAESKNPRHSFYFRQSLCGFSIRREFRISQAGRIQKSEALILFSSIALWF
jgi:hypothetical protein